MLMPVMAAPVSEAPASPVSQTRDGGTCCAGRRELEPRPAEQKPSLTTDPNVRKGDAR